MYFEDPFGLKLLFGAGESSTEFRVALLLCIVAGLLYRYAWYRSDKGLMTNAFGIEFIMFASATFSVLGVFLLTMFATGKFLPVVITLSELALGSAAYEIGGWFIRSKK